jgi:hypothetical protein
VKEDHFFQRSHNEYFTSDDTYGPGKGRYFSQDFKLDKEYDIYERQVYSLAGVLQDVGGFYNSLFFAGLLVYSQIQGTLFFSGIIARLYMVEEPMQISEDLKRSKTQGPSSQVNVKAKGSSFSNESYVHAPSPSRRARKAIAALDLSPATPSTPGVGPGDDTEKMSRKQLRSMTRNRVVKEETVKDVVVKEFASSHTFVRGNSTSPNPGLRLIPTSSTQSP